VLGVSEIVVENTRPLAQRDQREGQPDAPTQ